MLKERITTAQSRYVQTYREWLSGEWLSEPEVHGRFAELLNGRAPGPGLLQPEIRFEVGDSGEGRLPYRMLCVDGAMKDPDGEFAAFVCEGDQADTNETLTQSYRGMIVTAGRLRWDEIIVRVGQDPADDPAFLDWAQEWLGHDYELEVYLHYKVNALKYRVVEVPVSKIYRIAKDGTYSKARLADWFTGLKPVIYLRLGLKR